MSFTSFFLSLSLLSGITSTFQARCHPLKVYSPSAYVYHPTRTTLKALLRKIRLQARHKSFWNWQDIWLHLRPCGMEFWRSVRRDRNLPTLKAKLQFIGLIHYVRWVNVWEVLQVKFGGV